ncbi:recombination regulator RecX [Neisseria leonii]|uniref:recombination regulator RecX n=1 Tax=Neisseria leonii TaxID=2995413 RepID=UPI0030D1653A
MKPTKSLRSRALEILSRQEISRAELKKKLARHAESEEEIEAVISEFADRNWQSDERFAEAYIHSKSRRHGRLRLQQALAAKGVDADIVAPLLPGRNEELAAAVGVLEKKFAAPADNPADKLKQMRFLAYRGFDADTVRRALKTAWQEEETENG